MLAYAASAFVTLGPHHLCDGASRLGECPTHRFKAHRRIGISKPAGSFVSILDSHGQVLVFLKMAWKSPQGTQHSILVDNLDMFAHRNLAYANCSSENRECRE